MPRIKEGLPFLEECGITTETIKNFKNITIVACGTAMHAGMVGKYVIEDIARVPVNVDIASEFRYRNPIVGEGDLVIIISQSGETAVSHNLSLMMQCVLQSRRVQKLLQS